MNDIKKCSDNILDINNPNQAKIFQAVGTASLFSTGNADLDATLAMIHCALTDCKYMLTLGNLEIPSDKIDETKLIKEVVNGLNPSENYARVFVIRANWYNEATEIEADIMKIFRVIRLAGIHEELIPLRILIYFKLQAPSSTLQAPSSTLQPPATTLTLFRFRRTLLLLNHS